MFQPREQVKSPETNLNETDKSHLSHREFKIMLRRMLIEVRKAMHEGSENSNKEKILRSNRSHKIEDCNNGTDVLNIRIQQ